MRTSIRCAVVTVGALAAVGLAGPAAAAPKPGSCPTPAFSAVTVDELADVLGDVDPNLSEQEAAANAAGAFGAINANGDSLLCYRSIGRQFYVNVIDNAVQRRS